MIKLSKLNDVMKLNDKAPENTSQLMLMIGNDRMRLNPIFYIEIRTGSIGKLLSMLIFFPSRDKLTAGE